jgi:hypothetical protein
VKKKPIKILKKLTGSVRFQFYKPITKKTEPNQTQIGKKPSQTGKKPSKPSQTKKIKPNRKNRAKLEKTKPKLS